MSNDLWEELPNFEEQPLKNIKNNWENLKYRPYNSVILIALGWLTILDQLLREQVSKW